MPTLVIDNVPMPLYDRLRHLANSRHQTPADTALEMLETAFRATTTIFSEAPLPQEPFLTAEILAPCGIPRPEGKPTRAVRVATPLPSPHDFGDAE